MSSLTHAALASNGAFICDRTTQCSAHCFVKITSSSHDLQGGIVALGLARDPNNVASTEGRLSSAARATYVSGGSSCACTTHSSPQKLQEFLLSRPHKKYLNSRSSHDGKLQREVTNSLSLSSSNKQLPSRFSQQKSHPSFGSCVHWQAGQRLLAVRRPLLETVAPSRGARGEGVLDLLGALPSRGAIAALLRHWLPPARN